MAESPRDKLRTIEGRVRALAHTDVTAEIAAAKADLVAYIALHEAGSLYVPPSPRDTVTTMSALEGILDALYQKRILEVFETKLDEVVAASEPE